MPEHIHAQNIPDRNKKNRSDRLRSREAINGLRKLYLFLRALPKTLYFNLKYLPFTDAVKIPVIVSHRVWLRETRGEIILKAPPRPGLVTIGFGEVGIFDENRSRSIWKVSGRVIFGGKCSLGHGSKVCVAESGKLILGDDFIITAESSLLCRKRIEFGRGCLLSWDVMVMDTDYHVIRNPAGEQVNRNRPVTFGDHVWIGCRSLIMKGSEIASHCVISAGAVISGQYHGTNEVIGGNPPRTLKENIFWER